MKINPILKKDIKVTSRSMKVCWGLFAYELVLALIFVFTISIMFGLSSFSYTSITERYSYLLSLFPILGVTQVGIVALIIPIMTASSISGEVERQTFDIMLTTSMSPMSIIVGKVSSAVVRVMIYVIASIPIMSISFILGGLSWIHVFTFLIMIFAFSVFAGGIGIFCSAIFKKSLAAIVVAFIFYGIFFGATFIPSLIGLLIDEIFIHNGVYGNGFLWWLFNPVITFEEYFFKIFTDNESLITEIYESDSMGFFAKIIAGAGDLWIYVSVIVIFMTGVFFMWLAARKIDPMKNRKERKPVDKTV